MIEKLSAFSEIDLSLDRCGVYLLVSRGKVVYVGQSVCVDSRIAVHRLNRNNKWDGKTFDRAFWFPLLESQLDAYEGALIRAFNPKYNGTAPRTREHDADILAQLGIEPDTRGRFNRRMYVVRSRRMSARADSRAARARAGRVRSFVEAA